tara:strand:- start:709 stop:996 length:288 start_codon:yes stop_codon:yes gene_type:complete
MTDEEMEKLASIIVDKIAVRQQELDKEFIANLEQSQATVEVHVSANEIEKLEAEAFRLQNILKRLENEERYLDAANCKKDIKLLLDKIYKLKGIL